MTTFNSERTTLFNKADQLPLLRFVEWLFFLTPEDIARVELHCYRNGMQLKARAAYRAGLDNCGDDYENI